MLHCVAQTQVVRLVKSHADSLCLIQSLLLTALLPNVHLSLSTLFILLTLSSAATTATTAPLKATGDGNSANQFTNKACCYSCCYSSFATTFSTIFPMNTFAWMGHQWRPLYFSLCNLALSLSTLLQSECRANDWVIVNYLHLQMPPLALTLTLLLMAMSGLRGRAKWGNP